MKNQKNYSGDTPLYSGYTPNEKTLRDLLQEINKSNTPQMSEKSVSLYETKPYDDMFFTSKYSQRRPSIGYDYDTARTDTTRIYPTPDNKYHWERRSVWDLDEKDLLIPGEQRRRKIVPGISILPGTSIDADTLDMLKNDENPEYKPLRPFSQEPPVSWDLTRTPRPEQSYRTLLAEISRGTSEYPSMQSGSTPGAIPISDIQREDNNENDTDFSSRIQSMINTGIINPEAQKQRDSSLTQEEAAILSAHVYGDIDDSKLPNGWKVSPILQQEKYKQVYNSGLKAQLYEHTNEHGEIEYVLATAGTDTDNLKNLLADAKEDVFQVFGKGSQYNESANLAYQLYKDLNKKVTFVGHSLGGGLAAANAYKTGGNAITFNAAGISNATMDNLNLKPNNNIEAHVTLNDPLQKIQQILDPVFGINADGDKVYHVPTIGPLSHIRAHGIKAFTNPTYGKMISDWVQKIDKKTKR